MMGAFLVTAAAVLAALSFGGAGYCLLARRGGALPFIISGLAYLAMAQFA